VDELETPSLDLSPSRSHLSTLMDTATTKKSSGDLFYTSCLPPNLTMGGKDELNSLPAELNLAIFPSFLPLVLTPTPSSSPLFCFIPVVYKYQY